MADVNELASCYFTGVYVTRTLEQMAGDAAAKRYVESSFLSEQLVDTMLFLSRQCISTDGFAAALKDLNVALKQGPDVFRGKAKRALEVLEEIERRR